MSVIVFTRANDLDGITCAVIAKQAFGDDAKIILESPTSIDDRFVDTFDIKTYYDTDEEKEIYDIFGSDKLYAADRVYVVDLFLKDDLLYRIGRNPVVNRKFAIYDHHDDAIRNGAGHYLFNDVRKKDRNERLVSSANIFYENLIKKGLIQETKKLNDLVELVRLNITNDALGVEANNFAEQLKVLHEAVGDTGFFNSIQDKVSVEKNSKLEFDDREKKIIENYKKKQEQGEEPNEE